MLARMAEVDALPGTLRPFLDSRWVVLRIFVEDVRRASKNLVVSETARGRCVSEKLPRGSNVVFGGGYVV
jgi:hypothetical protein